MNKKSLLLATLLSGMAAFSGCEKSPQKTTTKAPNKTSITEVLNRPLYYNIPPLAMFARAKNGKCVQILYPIRKDGMVIESKDQYDKRLHWWNTKFPKNVSSLNGEWLDLKEPLKTPFVSFFDDRNYINYHIQWTKGWMKGMGKEYSPLKDDILSWWATNMELYNLLTPTEQAKLNAPVKNTRD